MLSPPSAQLEQSCMILFLAARSLAAREMGLDYHYLCIYSRFVITQWSESKVKKKLFSYLNMLIHKDKVNGVLLTENDCWSAKFSGGEATVILLNIL